MKVTVILLTWKRIPALKETLLDLTAQSYKNFNIYISNGNLEMSSEVDRIVSKFTHRLKIDVSHDGNDMKSFRRFIAAQKCARAGSEIILFLDDDIEIPANYIEKCLNQYEPKTYKSGFAWTFEKHGIDYYKYRTRRYDNRIPIHYCGTGVSMIDATVFLDQRLFDAPENALGIEDLWLSYYIDNLSGWKLMQMDMPKGVVIGGDDVVALYKTYLPANNAKYTKADFLRELVAMGWKI